MRTVAKMVMNGTYTVMYDDKVKYNPYKVYQHINGSRRIMEKYADLSSAMVYLANIAMAKESYIRGEQGA